MLTDIYYETWFTILLNCHLSTFFLRPYLDSWLIDYYFLFIEVRSNFDSGVVVLLNAPDCVCYILLDILNVFVVVLPRNVFVNDDFDRLRLSFRTCRVLPLINFRKFLK